MLTWYRRRKFQNRVLGTTRFLLRTLPGLYKAKYGAAKSATIATADEGFEENANPYQIGLAIASGFVTSYLSHDLPADKRAECLLIWEEKRQYGFTLVLSDIIRVSFGLVQNLGVDPLAMGAAINEITDTLKGIPPEQRRLNRAEEFLYHTNPENINRKAEFLRDWAASGSQGPKSN